ncbi:helix-turn-helix transcriptional regulator [Arcicella sp. LKC2W]|uniref:helix-turn-helix domain-containing protein n=1 Tax=Arcicella sp. LKC2W TaxID=2984198 RepID=UPI002B1FD338|nr:helix-turn-helix transcriptional regulator [Arcicella sp. LKC2W]MEA5461127.1 helix-turn-helix transcriptional regulator [Arcicella sp. LKC2W]
MNPTKNLSIDWYSPDVLEQIVQNIKNPLENIIAANQNNTLENKERLEEIIFSNTKEISDIVEEIMLKARSKSLNLTFQGRPDIFEIYEDNECVREMCADEIKPQKITKQDQEWLMNLEKEIYGSITKDFLNLNELSYKMAVSERQLHRKIANLVYLTPNKYIRILRLHKAKQMIDSYIHRSISQIAYAVGYNDVHYFSTLFSGQYKITPKDLLNSLR